MGQRRRSERRHSRLSPAPIHAALSAVLVAMQNLVNTAAISVHEPAATAITKLENGAASTNAVFNALYQQAASEEVSVFVASRRSGRSRLRSPAATVRRYEHRRQQLEYHSLQRGGQRLPTSATRRRITTTPLTGARRMTTASLSLSALLHSGKFPGMIPAPTRSCFTVFFGFLPPYGTANGFCQSSTARQNQLVTVAASSSGPATALPQRSGIAGSGERNLPGLCRENLPGNRAWRVFRGDGVAHYPSQRVAVRGRRRLGALLHHLLVRQTKRWNPLRRVSRQLGRSRRDLVLLSDSGGHSGSGQSESSGRSGRSRFTFITGCSCTARSRLDRFHNVTSSDKHRRQLQRAQGASGYTPTATAGQNPGRGGVTAVAATGARASNGALSLSTQSYDAAYGRSRQLELRPRESAASTRITPGDELAVETPATLMMCRQD